MASLHISISAEPIATLGPLQITNSIFTSLIISLFLIFIAYSTNRKLNSRGRPTGLQNLFEMIIDGFYNLTNTVTQNRQKSAFIFPIILTAFLWILLNNWSGLIPGVGTIGFSEPATKSHATTSPIAVNAAASSVQELSQALPETADSESDEVEESGEGPKFVPLFRAGTADLNTTLALALFSVTATQIMGLKFLGPSYLSKFFNLKGIFAFVGFLELVSEISKIISFTFRLFGNIFAGEVLLAVMAYLVPIIVPTPFLFLEIFVGVIQALVFALLTLVFMNMASLGHEGEH